MAIPEKLGGVCKNYCLEITIVFLLAGLFLCAIVLINKDTVVVNNVPDAQVVVNNVPEYPRATSIGPDNEAQKRFETNNVSKCFLIRRCFFSARMS